ncbi:MAG TPA: twin-arginine translocase subunit TatC [Bacteroidia bacterium]|nr:twin-arginine translocase subunit TatC [Bacteroidia bacterium]HRH08391.1 twin-arginine translocase subunit TatC [Bacteroidia bacterium]HRH63030.1 twin-arginine translocase subunit TatC [Bacteroidia bacterium]
MFERFKKAANPASEMSFLEHLEALRWHLVRSAIVVFSLAILAFVYNDILFDKIIFAPRHADFWTYVQMCRLSDFLGLGDALCIKSLNFDLINTQLSGQFTMHMWIAFVAGLILGFPYVIWELWRFVKPGLKETERKYTSGLVFFISSLFAIGVAFGYYIIAPLSINFLGNYQMSSDVKNMIEMDSFISTITTITLASGLVFELPIVVYFLTKIGLMSPQFMRKFRKHAVIVILIVAAVITPSPDVTSQLLVAFPLYLLYEISIFVSMYVLKKGTKNS